MASTTICRETGVAEETIMIDEPSEPPGKDSDGGPVSGTAAARPSRPRANRASR